jgi:uncharacterized protein YqgV (UPF0045/DUF77 family)
MKTIKISERKETIMNINYSLLNHASSIDASIHDVLDAMAEVKEAIKNKNVTELYENIISNYRKSKKDQMIVRIINFLKTK